MWLLTFIALTLLLSGAVASVLAYYMMNPMQRILTGRTPSQVWINAGVNLFYAALIYILAQPHGSL